MKATTANADKTKPLAVSFTSGEDAGRVSALERFQKDLSEHGIQGWGKITESAIRNARDSVSSTMRDQKDRVLKRAQNLVSDALEGKRYAGQAEFLTEMRRILGFPTKGNFGDDGSMANLAGDRRLRMIYDMQMTRAHAEIKAERDKASGADVLFPAQELVRGASVKEPRDWIARWSAAGGQFYDGRMVALKDDPIWERISAFGDPYPPFDYNSQMVTRDVSLRDAIDLGLLPESAFDDAMKEYEERTDESEQESEQESEPELPLRQEPQQQETATQDTHKKQSEEEENIAWLRKNLPEELADRAIANGFATLSNKEVRLLKTKLGNEALKRDDLMIVNMPTVKFKGDLVWGGPAEAWTVETGKTERVLAFKPHTDVSRPYEAHRDGKEGTTVINHKFQRGYFSNCYDCVPTDELWLRGYNVEALPTTTLDKMKKERHLAQWVEWERTTPAGRIKTPTENNPARYLFMGEHTSGYWLDNGEGNSLEKLTRYVQKNNIPPGRYQIGFVKNTGGAHTTCMKINEDRTLSFFDPQIGSTSSDFLRNIGNRLYPELKPLYLNRIDNRPMNLRLMTKITKVVD